MSEEKWFVFHKSTGTPVKWGFVSEQAAERWIEKRNCEEEYEAVEERFAN